MSLRQSFTRNHCRLRTLASRQLNKRASPFQISRLAVVANEGKKPTLPKILLQTFSSAPVTDGTTSSTLNTNEVPVVSGVLRLLKDEERELLTEQKRIVAQARKVAGKVGLQIQDDKEANVLEDCSTFSIVVAGEYNAGKSTLVNALVGQKLLESGSLPTTDRVTILSSQPPPPSLQASSSLVDYHQLPDSPLLQDLTLVDTPGTNAVLTNHTVQTLRLLPAADWILFVTSADRPLSESERSLLEAMAHSYRKSIAIVINKMDIFEQSGGLHGANEKQRVVDFVTEHASQLLGAKPVVLAVSSRDALVATHNGALRDRSNFAELESFLKETLTTAAKLQSKLTSPLGGAEHLLQTSQDKLQQESRELEADEATLNLLSSHLEGWRRELESEMEHVRRQLTNYQRDQGQRGHILLRRLSWLDFYRDIKRDWEQTGPLGSGSAQKDLLLIVEEAAAAIATRGRAQGQAVIEFLGHRSTTNRYSTQSLVGRVTAASRFEETRTRIEEQLTNAVEHSVPAKDSSAAALLQSLERAAMTSIALNAAALGVLAFDFMVYGGTLSASLGAAGLAATGGAAAVLGRQQAAKNHAEHWQRMSEDLDRHVQTVLNKESELVDRRVREGVAPYARFVQAERKRLEELQGEVDRTMAASQRLRLAIQRLR